MKQMILKMKAQTGTFATLSKVAVMMFVGAFAAAFGGSVHAADTFKGQKLYAANCALCHGASGNSVMPGAPNFSRGERVLQPDFTLLASIRSGKNAMPAFQGILSDRDIMDVIAYLRTLH